MKYLYCLVLLFLTFGEKLLAQTTAQKGLLVFGKVFFEKYYEEKNHDAFTFIIEADTIKRPASINKSTRNSKSIETPSFTFIKVNEKRMTTLAIDAYFDQGRYEFQVNNNPPDQNKYSYFSTNITYGERYNYWNLWRKQIKFYIGSEIKLRGSNYVSTRSNVSETYTSLSLGAYTSIAYFHKNRYWFEIGFPKEIGDVTWTLVPSFFGNHQVRGISLTQQLTAPFYPVGIRIGGGVLF